MYNERSKLMVKQILHNHRSEYMIITFERCQTKDGETDGWTEGSL